MRTLKYAVLGVALISLLFSSFSFISLKNRLPQKEALTFCETYTQKEVISKLDSKDTFFTWVLMEGTDPESSRIGTCQEADLKHLWNYIQGEAFRSQLPGDLIIAVGAEAFNQMIPLYAIRKSVSNNSFPSQQDIDEVSIGKDNDEENYALYLSFSESGAEKWATMTRMNKGKAIAILFNGKVLAAPRVQEEIKNGKCMISGKYTEDEINTLKAAFEN
jgi:hypothetical protein